jgi:hypothetical protein
VPAAGPEGFVSTTVARRWDHGLVAGTGTVGAVLQGTPARHVIDLAHEEFFSTVMDHRPAPDLAPALPETRRLLLAHDAAGAAGLVDDRAAARGLTGLIWTDPFAPAASVTIEPQADGTGAFADYRRAGRFESGAVSAGWTTHGEPVEVTVLALRGRDAVAVKITSVGPLTVTHRRPRRRSRSPSAAARRTRSTSTRATATGTTAPRPACRRAARRRARTW